MKKLFLLTSILSFFAIAKAQDIHFSQFNMSPLNINPGLVGQFEGQYRFHAGYRDQWSSVTVPYRTFTFSADGRDLFHIKGFNLGAIINQDRAGDSKFNTFQFNLTPGYAMRIGAHHYLSLGTQLGITNRNLKYDDLYFDNQYNGNRYDSELGNGENFELSSRTYLNIHAGFAYRWQKTDRTNLTVGGGVYNINQPKQTYFSNMNIILDKRYTFQVSSQFKIAEKWDILPESWFNKQGEFQELILGSSARYILKKNKDEQVALLAGFWFRNKDAGFISFGGEYNLWKLQLSYDLNFSKLVPASNNRGGFEIQLRYILKKWNPTFIQHRVCPNYI